jgi:hypothetical protein
MAALEVAHTKTDVIKLAVEAELDRLKHSLDAEDHLRSISIDVKLKPGGSVRAVIVRRESERATL